MSSHPYHWRSLESYVDKWCSWQVCVCVFDFNMWFSSLPTKSMIPSDFLNFFSGEGFRNMVVVVVVVVLKCQSGVGCNKTVSFTCFLFVCFLSSQSVFVQHFNCFCATLQQKSIFHLDLQPQYVMFSEKYEKIHILLFCFSNSWAGGGDKFCQGDDKWERGIEHRLGWERQSNATWGASMPSMPAGFTDPRLWCPCSSPAPRETHAQVTRSSMCVYVWEVWVCASEGVNY